MGLPAGGFPLALLLAVIGIHAAVAQSALGDLESTHQCFEDHEDPRYSDQRVCIFENLLVHQNNIYYVSRSITQLPKIVISWEKWYEGDQHLRLNIITPEQLPAGIDKVKTVREAGLFHQQHPSNFYHLFTEIAPTVHYVVCKYLGRCTYQKHDQLRIYWVNHVTPERPQTLTFGMPRGIADLFQCLSAFPVQNIYHATQLEGQTLLLKKAVVGLPRHARFYHQKKDEWRERFQDPPPLDFMHSYRVRVADCLGYDFVNAVAPTSPIRVTFVNRHYEDGRHILNANRLREQLLALPAVKELGKQVEINVVYLEGTLREQAAVIWNTSIYLWSHGAAMAQTFFLPRGAQALEIVQWVVADPIDQHIWVQGIKAAFGLQIGLGVLTNNDPTKVFFNYDIIRAPGSQYHKFNDTEKVMLLEDLECPTWRAKERGIEGGECFGWFHWGMSLKLDFALLRPRFEAALANLTQSVAALKAATEPGIASGGPGGVAAEGGGTPIQGGEAAGGHLQELREAEARAEGAAEGGGDGGDGDGWA